MSGFNLTYWNERISSEIPATRLLQLTIEQLDGQTILATAPIEPNKNGHDTAFAGSIYTLGITTGWTYINAWARELALDTKIVALDARIRYRKPISGQLKATNLTDLSASIQDWPKRLDRDKKFTEPLEVNIGDDKIPDAASLDILFHISKR